MAVKTQFGETIFALSTAPGRAGVAVIRLSGPQALEAALSLSGGRPLPPRRASLRTLRADGHVIDEALILHFPAPNSFTGETVVELHCHGSHAVIESVSEALLALGLRQARAGEFTRRAVENGRMDLTEAEGLADLIDAQTATQARQALRQMEGALRETYESWREGLLDALALIEGEIDFADEADVPDALSHAARAPLERVAAGMEAALARSTRGYAVRDGIEIAIIGAPNAGKSTLLNRLVGRDVAITSPQAGTTRDIVEARMVLAGLPVTLSDTAGLREAADAIEAEGVRRAHARAKDAQLRIGLVREGMDEAGGTLPLRSDDIRLYNVANPSKGNEINALSGAGLDVLLERLEEIVRERFTGGEPPSVTRARHADCVRRAAQAARSAQKHLGSASELAGEDIRTALRALDELAGRSDIEEVFDRIFSQFCVGK
ncbi:MAG: tRNA uridine-5-carboxymethylaminomethyl(34) synthesis GTPase MnmE [Pseudomonadota bacterium]